MSSTDRPQGNPTPPWHTILSGSGFNRGQVPPDQMRISDAERQQVADALGKHFAEGRLDQSELDERMTRAMGAKTRGDLRGLLDDLPPHAPFGAGGGVGGGMPMAPPRRAPLPRLLVIVAAVLVAMAAGAAFAAPWHFPWVLFLILAFLAIRGPLRRGRWHHHHHHHGPQDNGPNGCTWC